MTFEYLTDIDVALLNAARTILVEAAERASRDSYMVDGVSRLDAMNLGSFRARCEDAEHAIFKALNIARNHLGAPLSDAQLHNREDVTA